MGIACGLLATVFWLWRIRSAEVFLRSEYWKAGCALVVKPLARDHKMRAKLEMQ